MPVTSANIPLLLKPGAREIAGLYPTLDRQWVKVFTRRNSDLQSEYTPTMRYLGLPGIKNPGQAPNVDNQSRQVYAYQHTHTAYGLMYGFTREAMDDNLYTREFDPANLGLAKAFQAMEETVAADVFNYGNVFNAAQGGDGVALFATNHPVDGYSIPNTPATPIGLNESSLLAAENGIRQFRDQAGVLILAQAKKLVVPIQLRHTARRLTVGQYRPGSADNDVAVVKENNDLSDGYIALDYLTNPFAWFVLSNQGGLIMLERVPFEINVWVDKATQNLLVSGYQRYYFGFDRWSSAYGSFPSS